MNLRRTTWTLFLPVVLMALSACGSDDEAGAGPTWPLPPTSETTTGPDDPTRPAEGSLVEVATSGGIDGRGIGDLVVSDTGELRRSDRQAQVEDGTLTSGELDELVDMLEATDFAAAPSEPDIEDVCPDALIYTVSYEQWQVTADDCTIPAEIEPVMDRLRELMGRFD